MTHNVNDGGPAFPIPDMPHPDDAGRWLSQYRPTSDGMSIRDWFASQALIGILSGAKAGNGECLRNLARLSAETAFIVADAMLEARWKQL